MTAPDSTTGATTAGTSKIGAAIVASVDEARAEVTRTDTKAGTLLTLATGALALSALSQFLRWGVIRSRNSPGLCSSWTVSPLVMFVGGTAIVRL